MSSQMIIKETLGEIIPWRTIVHWKVGLDQWNITQVSLCGKDVPVVDGFADTVDNDILLREINAHIQQHIKRADQLDIMDFNPKYAQYIYDRS